MIEKPVVVFGIDNSKSMMLSKDSSTINTEFINRLSTLKARLEDKYKLETYLFGEQVILSDQPEYDQQISNYADFIMKMKEDYSGTNFGALVMAGDGINNRGIDPVFAASSTNYPIYTIALGDTTTARDLKINDVRYNSIIYLGDDFPLEVNVSGKQLKGENAILRVYAFDKQKARQNISISTNDYNRSFRFSINASKPGKQRIRIVIETETEEVNSGNNSRNIFFDVLDNRQKILIIANAPHPDLSAIRKSIEQKKNFELKLEYASDFKGLTDGYDLIILHQLPAIQKPMHELFGQIEKKEIPVLYILGKQSNISLFNQHYKGVDFRIAGRNIEEAQAIINPNFSLFTFDDEFASVIEKFPPLIVHLGNYQVLPSTSIFASQRISKLETDYPLVAFSPIEGIKNGFIAGEGLWMWRMHNYLQEENTKAFDTFIEKTVQLLLLRKDKRFFRVITDGEYTGNRNVVVNAELYNQSYEAVNTTDVNFSLTNEAKEKFNYVFSPFDKAYSLDLKRLPIGVYQYLASTRLGTETYTSNGEFVVTGESLESRSLQANHAMLYRMAIQNDGEMLYLNQIDQLADKLAARQTLKSKIYYEEKYTGLFNLWWVIGLILSLLSLEWFLRKYFGTY